MDDDFYIPEKNEIRGKYCPWCGSTDIKHLPEHVDECVKCGTYFDIVGNPEVK